MLYRVMSGHNPIQPSRLALPGAPVSMDTGPPPPTNPPRPPSPLVIGAEGGATLHTPLDKDGNRIFFTPPSPGIQARMDTLIQPYTLNQVKHTNRILEDLNKPNVSIKVNKQGEDVGIQCNPGFWVHVAKPLLCSPATGYIFKCPNVNISFLLADISYQTDKAGTETCRILKLAFTSQGNQSEITVTLHMGTRKVQVQGSLIMPDCNPSGIWFVTNILSPSLSEFAKTKNVDISAFHSAILEMSARGPPSSSRKSSTGGQAPKCEQCNGSLRGGLATPCAARRCSMVLHKSRAPTSKHKCISQPPAPPQSHSQIPLSHPPQLTVTAPPHRSPMSSTNTTTTTTTTTSSLSSPLLSLLPPLLAPASGAGAAFLSQAVSGASRPPVSISQSTKRPSSEVSFLDSEEDYSLQVPQPLSLPPVTLSASSPPVTQPPTLPPTFTQVTHSFTPPQVTLPLTFSNVWRALREL